MQPQFDHTHQKGSMKPGRFNEVFRRIAAGASAVVGSKWAFVSALALIVLWAASYPLFHHLKDGFNTWQLVINTLTTIITFLMVFLIQNTQNRDAKAIHLKLDELIRGVKGARTRLVNLEEFSDEELEQLQKQFESLRAHAGQAHETSHRAHETAVRARQAAQSAEAIAQDAIQSAPTTSNHTAR